MTHAARGSMIGGIFGLVFVLVNSGRYPDGVRVVVHVAAVLAFVVLLVALLRRSRAGESEPARPEGAGRGFGRGYRLVVAAEAIALFGGAALLNGPLDLPDASVGWIALVVGVHFFALARVWREPFFTGLGLVLAALGAVGVVLALSGAPGGLTDTVGGVLPGAVLIAAGFHRPAPRQ